MQLDPSSRLRREVAFRRLKELVTSDRVVKIPQVGVNFFETDASLNAISTTINWFFRKRIETALSDFSVMNSQSLSAGTQCTSARCSPLLKPAYTIVFFLNRLLTERTDHTALRRILTSSLRESALVEKWVLRLSEYDVDLEHIPVNKNSWIMRSIKMS